MFGMADPSSFEGAGEDEELGLAASPDVGIDFQESEDTALVNGPMLEEYNRKLQEFQQLSCDCSICTVSSKAGHLSLGSISALEFSKVSGLRAQSSQYPSRKDYSKAPSSSSIPL